MEKLSVVIITKNEERNIGRCLASVAWADEIVILDTGSNDRTLDLSREHNCRIEHTEWHGFGPAKQKAVACASHSWILSVDADEEVSPELRNEIQHILGGDGTIRFDAYRLKRRTWYVDRWIRHSGWNSDTPVRLFEKHKAGFNEKLIHESVEVRGTIGTIGGLLYHYSYPDLVSHLDKMRFFTALAAEQRIGNRKRGSVTAALLHGCSKFIKMYLLQAGFLDGKTGFVLAVNSAFGIYFKHLLYWEQSLQREISAADSTA
ncbi:MAG: glycosyltransferase family 2 protein [Chitinispirillaceae bacterium]|nr:glycosyltransferase family 2 protein [Chitinispirillaceae bacterium]